MSCELEFTQKLWIRRRCRNLHPSHRSSQPVTSPLPICNLVSLLRNPVFRCIELKLSRVGSRVGVRLLFLAAKEKVKARRVRLCSFEFFGMRFRLGLLRMR